MANRVDIWHGITSGFLAGLVSGGAIILYTIILMTVSGVPVPSSLYTQLIGLGLIAWPVSWGLSLGSLLGLLYAAMHQNESESLSMVGGWFYGILFSLPYMETGFVISVFMSFEVALLYLAFVTVVSTFVFGTLLVAF